MLGAARANPVEVFGFGSEHAAKVGAAAATVEDFAAGYYNPAGIAFAPRKTVSAGILSFASNLEVQGERQPISDSFGVLLGATAPAPLGGALENLVHVGIGMYVPPQTIVRVIARFPDEPLFPYYDNRTQRMVLLPTLALRPHRDLALGVAVNYLATLSGAVDAREGATRGIEARVDEEIPAIARVNAGIAWRVAALDGLQLAATFRQKFDIPFRTNARVQVAGEPIAVDIAASGVFTPTQLVGAIAWRGTSVTANLDVTWSNWSSYDGPFVTVRSELPLVGPLVAELPRVPFSDTIAARFGGEARRAIGTSELAFRAGYGFETSAFPAEQSGVTNLFDGFKHFVGAGIGLRLAAAQPVRIDVHVQAHLVGERTFEKRISGEGEERDPFTSLRDELEDDPADPNTAGAQISNPGYPSITGGGQVFSAGVTMGVEF